MSEKKGEKKEPKIKVKKTLYSLFREIYSKNGKATE